LLRVGWSLNDTSLQLGEDVYSYAYCSNGKKCCNKQFEDYGEIFQKGDSIAAYLVCFFDQLFFSSLLKRVYNIIIAF
jgi:hypothetical protein